MKHLNMSPPHEGRPSGKPRATSLLLAIVSSALLFTHSSLRASEMDEKIEASAGKTYVFRTFLAEDSIKTTSKDGAVTLTGTVSEESHKSLAQETVSGLPGVKSVDNQIEVKGAPPERSDTWLYLKVKSALAMHRSVNAFKTQVELKEGVVTLKGEASSEAQRELAAEYAQDVEGVKGVKNEMTVATTVEKPAASMAEMIDDASITAQVRMALWTHRSTNAFKTSITTTDGVVTVSGAAKNTAEVDLVTKLIKDINGVKSVMNNMNIEPAPVTK